MSANPQKHRTSLNRVSLDLYIGQTWIETSLLAGTVRLVMIVELLNTSIESAINRIDPEWHELAKSAKDIGSAAVFLSLLLCIAVWAAAIQAKYFT